VFNDPNVTHEIFSSRKKVPAATFVGQQGRIFYHEDTGELRLSDGHTPGGLPIFFQSTGGGGGTLSLQLYAETGIPAIAPVASTAGAIALGDGALAHYHGSLVHSAGVFTHAGDAQSGSYVLRGVTTSNTKSELFLDGVAMQLMITPNTAVAFTITVMARRTDTLGSEGAVYQVQGGIDRTVSTISTRIIGKISQTVVSEDNPSWNVTADADITTGALRVWVTGENSKTIRWVAHIQTVEVQN
jgi:hypothetical protein